MLLFGEFAFRRDDGASLPLARLRNGHAMSQRSWFNDSYVRYCTGNLCTENLAIPLREKDYGTVKSPSLRLLRWTIRTV